MNPPIVVNMNNRELNDSDNWSKPHVLEKYPGSGFLKYLVGLAIGGRNARDNDTRCILIQEEGGCVGPVRVEPRVVFCLESPLYTPFFYDQLPEYKNRFPHQLLFGDLGTHQAFFPSYDLEDLRKPLGLAQRMVFPTTCAVISNKHYSQYADLFKDSPSWQSAIKDQLHDARYAFIAPHEDQEWLAVFGKGWPQNRELPPGTKVEAIRNYQFCYCPENLVMPGYITEKIIDAMVAGCVPIYEGAPDITKYIPQECFITPSMGGDVKIDRQAIIDAGQTFLVSPESRKFSYQHFAQTLLHLALDKPIDAVYRPEDPHEERSSPPLSP